MYEQEAPASSPQYEWWTRTRIRNPLPAVFEMEQNVNKLFRNKEPERSNAKMFGGIYGSIKKKNKTKKLRKKTHKYIFRRKNI